jgi:hypothetical protein
MEKLSKIAVLESWYGIDKILFGNEHPKKKLTEDVYNKYLKKKAAFCMNLYEFYNDVNYFTNRSYLNKKDLMETSRKRGKICLENSVKFIKTKLSKKDYLQETAKIRKETKLNETSAKKLFLSKKILETAIDGLTLESAIKNMKCKTCLETQGNKIRIQAHKKLRDSLIEISKSI